MKLRNTFPLLVILILATVIATTSTSAAIVPQPGPSASGSGLFRFRNSQTEQINVWSFTFEAIANKNGQTHGRAQFENLTAGTQVVVRINCLSVSSGLGTDFASIGGVVLHSSDPNLPKRLGVLFAATDGTAFFGTDTITPVFGFDFAGQDCHDTQPLTILPVEDGDIEIQP